MVRARLISILNNPSLECWPGTLSLDLQNGGSEGVVLDTDQAGFVDGSKLLAAIERLAGYLRDNLNG